MKFQKIRRKTNKEKRMNKSNKPIDKRNRRERINRKQSMN